MDTGPGRLAAALLGLLLAAAPAGAERPTRYWLIGQLPPDGLDRTDWLLLRQNVQLALYDLPDGQSVNWVNPARGHSGYVKTLATFPVNDKTCRLLRVSVDLEFGSETGMYQLCRVPGGFWTFPTRVRPVLPVE